MRHLAIAIARDSESSKAVGESWEKEQSETMFCFTVILGLTVLYYNTTDSA